MSIASKLTDLHPFISIADSYELYGDYRVDFMRMVQVLLNVIEEIPPLTEERSAAEETLLDTVETYCEMYNDHWRY